MAEQSARKDYADALSTCTPDELQRVQDATLRLVTPPIYPHLSPEEYYADDPEELQKYYDASERAYERCRMAMG